MSLLVTPNAAEMPSAPVSVEECLINPSCILIPSSTVEESERSGPTPDVSSGQAVEEEMVVNAWEVKGVIDYNKLVDQFGSKLIG